MILTCLNTICLKEQGLSIDLTKSNDTNDKMTNKYQWSAKMVCRKCNCIYYDCVLYSTLGKQNKVLVKTELAGHHEKVHALDLENIKATNLKRKHPNDMIYEKPRRKK